MWLVWGERKNVGKPVGKRPTARQSHRCEDIIKMGFKTVSDGMDMELGDQHPTAGKTPS
jgi:hypothetical protein